MNIVHKGTIDFPVFSGIRCLMMPYLQGEPESVPPEYGAYSDIIASQFFHRGDIGYLTIDESQALKGTPHRGTRAKFGRALHTEAGAIPNGLFAWGSGGGSWGGRRNVLLERGVRIMLANSLSGSCAIWDREQTETSDDGDIGYLSDKYPLEKATLMQAGEIFEIGILTPHESLPVAEDYQRQFLRIVSSGVHGREPYFTPNPLMEAVRDTP